jgi:hypothetical protein
MLRDLSTMLEDLHSGMLAATRRMDSAVHIARAQMTLPVDAALVLKDGGCVLLADVPRNAADAPWQPLPSRLTLVWDEVPTETLP